jgi:hypothetical protein
MRKLGSTQLAVLRHVALQGDKGITKSDMFGGDWRVIDRLEQLGLVTNRFVRGQGPTYFINDAGRVPLHDHTSGDSK